MPYRRHVGYNGSDRDAARLTGLDFAGDIRDLTYDITHWDGSLKHAGQTLLDVVGLIPGIGALKNADEVAALLKQALKAAPALTDGAKYALKNVDVIAAGITGLFKNSDELGEIGKAAGKTAEDIAREYAETARLMKNADKADEAASAVAGAGKPAASEASDALGKAIDAEWYGGKAATEGVTEGAGDVGKVITKINYVPSSGVIFKTNPNKTTTILGSFDKDMKNIVNEMGNVKSTYFGARKGGFNVLNVPDELYDPDTFWDLYNKPWLDKVINRGDDIVLATKPDKNVLTRIDYSTGEEVFTGFGQEIDYLTKNGYIYNTMTNTMKLR